MKDLYPLSSLSEPSHSTFLGLPLPEDQVRQYQTVVSALQSLELPVTYQAGETPHLTLNYFGSVDLQGIHDLSRCIEQVTMKTRSFETSIAHVNYFGPPRQRKVLWLEVESHQYVEELQQRITQSLPSKFHEARPYISHFTIARIKNPRIYDAKEPEVLRLMQNVKFQFRADRIRLYGAVGKKRQIPFCDYIFQA